MAKHAILSASGHTGGLNAPPAQGLKKTLKIGRQIVQKRAHWRTQ